MKSDSALPSLASAIWRPAPDQAARWDAVFAGERRFCVDAPNAWLVESVRGRAPGVALDVGAGDGRNSLWLAGAGWKVHAIDLSEVALQRLRGRAGTSRVTTEHVDVTAFPYGENRWDLIVMTYLQTLTLKLAPAVCTALRAGGMFVAEAFHEAVNAAAGKPLGIPSNSLLRAYGELRVLRYQDVEASADWIGGEVARVVRLCAMKDGSIEGS